jgi:hypothetical protein
MIGRVLVSAAALALTLGVGGESYAQTSSSAQVRPAQMPRASGCDQLMRAVEIEMPTAAGVRVLDAQRETREAQELCNSGQEAEGMSMLRGVLNSLHLDG